jgi:hypothetical protein
MLKRTEYKKTEPAFFSFYTPVKLYNLSNSHVVQNSLLDYVQALVVPVPCPSRLQ